MKSLITVILVLVLCSCTGMKSTNETSTSVDNSHDWKGVSDYLNDVTLVSGCLPEGECSFEVMQNTKMDFKIDSAGMLYPEFIDSKGTSTVKFTYNENADKAVMDGHYREEFYFEFKKGTDEMNLENAELANVNFLYGRFCYCKGSAGYFKVREGTLLMEEGRLIISFANGQVPQKLSKITAEYN